MALKQMGIARMGNYRPKHDAVNRGGKTGRPKLLHNGDRGNGLTGGGGLNAKGSGGGIKVNKAMKPMQRQLRKSKYAANKFNAMKINEREKNQSKRAEAKTRTQGGPAMNPHPIGSFMYGQNQWGSINARGQVDWTAAKPMAGKPIIGFQEALPWLYRTPHLRQIGQQFVRNRRVAPASYWDPIYFRNKGQLQLAQQGALADLSQQQSQVDHDYDYALKDLNTDYMSNTARSNALMGGNNAAESGVAAAQLGELAKALGLAMTKNEEQKHLSDTEIASGRTQANNAFNVGLAGEESMARERWLATHQGQKLPASNRGKIYTQGGIRYRQNAQGIPMTYTQPKKKKGNR